jgi:2,3,4,5-tetrahydropyridine-2-carboxylate N-succinyltransferase
MSQYQVLIEEAFANRDLLTEPRYQDAVRAVVDQVDKGTLRVAEPLEGGWQVQQWVKQAILLYFGIQKMKTWDLPPFEFYDKMELKKELCRTRRTCCSARCSPLWCLYRP